MNPGGGQRRAVSATHEEQPVLPVKSDLVRDFLVRIRGVVIGAEDALDLYDGQRLVASTLLETMRDSHIQTLSGIEALLRANREPGLVPTPPKE